MSYTKEQLEAMEIPALEALMTDIHNQRKVLLEEQQAIHDILEAKEIDIALLQKMKLNQLTPGEKARALQILQGSLIPKEDAVNEGG